MIADDIAFMKRILPGHYTVEESKKKGSLHCVSTIGIRKGIDAEDDEHWSYVFKAIKNNFGERFMEVFHNVCFCHTDFTIYLHPSYYIRVDHELGFFSFYDILVRDYNNYHDAEKEARRRFVFEFCGGNEESRKQTTAYTFNKRYNESKTTHRP